jgi:predicted metal-dependent hydrolase
MAHRLYQLFFCHYHRGEYWEAHEVLEELWQMQRHNDFYHGLIQIAAIMHQLRRGKVRGARKLAASAMKYLAPFAPEKEGVSVERVLAWLNRCLERLPDGVEKLEPDDPLLRDIPVCPLPTAQELNSF